MNQEQLDGYKTLPGFWQEVLSAHLSGQPLPAYHLIPMTEISLGQGNPPAELVVKSKTALKAHGDLGWMVLREACPETDDLLQKLGGAGSSSALALMIMANVRSLITPERDRAILAQEILLSQTRYKAPYAEIFGSFITISQGYVTFLERTAVRR